MLCDRDIRSRCLLGHRPMISPFTERVEGKGIITYGLSSYGYDIRIADEFKVFSPVSMSACGLVDPKDPRRTTMVEHQGEFCIIPPNSFALARTVERFDIPRDVLTVCLGKSTYARCGIIVNVTPFEPEWRGHATMEISNSTPLPAKIYANEGIAQLLFFQAGLDFERLQEALDFVGVLLRGKRKEDLRLGEAVARRLCETSYADRHGKYQDQTGIVEARVL